MRSFSGPVRRRRGVSDETICHVSWRGRGGSGLREFESGDHIRVRRLHLYWHHGIYVGKDEVVEFGGGNLAEKYKARLRRVRLQDFERGSGATILTYPRPLFFGLRHVGEALPRDEIVRRAEYLCGCETKGLYNLLGSNCEALSEWCAGGESGLASAQVVGWVLAPAMLWFVLFWRKRRRWGPRQARRHFLLVVPMFAYDYLNVRAQNRWKRILDGFDGTPKPV